MSLTRETKVPGIPPVPAKFDTMTRNFLNAIKEAVEVRLGVRGDPLDQSPTLRQLNAGGILGLLANANGYNVVPYGEGDTNVGGPNTDPDIPPAPQNLRAYGGLAIITLTWDPPSYSNHSYTEIWRSDKNDFNSAFRLGTSLSAFYVDNVAKYAFYWYWVRFVNKKGVAGPFNSREGTPGETATDPEYIMDLLDGQLTEDQLYKDLNTRIDLIDTPETGIYDRLVQTENSITQISQQVAALSPATPYAEGIAYAVDDQVVYDNKLYRCIQAFTPPPEHAPTETAYWTKVLDGVELSALIQQEATTRADADTTIASSVTTLQTVVADHSASLQVQATSINGLSVQYTVKIDNNGYVTGYGLASSPVNGIPLSRFIVNVDRFVIAPPSGSGLAVQAPFYTLTSDQYIDDGDGHQVLAHAGTYMRNAYIVKGSISNAYIGNYIQATNYVPNVSGWKIDKLGNIEINGGSFILRNSYGQVIFGSAQAPLGTLASQNYTVLGSTTFGYGSLALLNQIPNGTYIANAIVDTLHIAGGAVTSTYFAINYAGAGVNTNPNTRVLSINFPALNISEWVTYIIDFGCRTRARSVSGSTVAAHIYWEGHGPSPSPMEISNTSSGSISGTETFLVHTSWGGGTFSIISYTSAGSAIVDHCYIKVYVGKR